MAREANHGEQGLRLLREELQAGFAFYNRRSIECYPRIARSTRRPHSSGSLTTRVQRIDYSTKWKGSRSAAVKISSRRISPFSCRGEVAGTMLLGRKRYLIWLFTCRVAVFHGHDRTRSFHTWNPRIKVNGWIALRIAFFALRVNSDDFINASPTSRLHNVCPRICDIWFWID